MTFISKPPDKLDITLPLVTSLIREQFPNWSHLQIRPIEPNGWDNKTFCLGDEMSIRLPSAKEYALQVQKEHEWLPKLAEHLSIQIPVPIAIGKPSKDYPLEWSIYKWTQGQSANVVNFDDHDLQVVALDLAKFLKQLHKIDSTGGPLPGLHNYWRGDNVIVYDHDARKYIHDLKNMINYDKAMAVWERAISSKWGQVPVWIHGDFASGNILIKNKKLSAIIDFGCMGIGDPACDLVISWTFLKKASRKIFKENVGLDPDTWARARGWALWKASFELISIKDKISLDAMKQQKIINEILDEEEE